jgi:hypothetical protein
VVDLEDYRLRRRQALAERWRNASPNVRGAAVNPVSLNPMSRATGGSSTWRCKAIRR